MPETVLALDIGGTKIAAALIVGAEAGELVQAPTPAQAGPDAVLDAAWDTACAAMGDARPARLAVASAGVIDPGGGLVTSATDSIRGWAGTDLRGGLVRRSGMETTVLNDVHAHTWGEFIHGRGAGSTSMMLIAAGTGIGGGLVVGSQLVFGARNVAGHLGHVDVQGADGVPCTCGRSGHVEGIASGTGMEQQFERATGQRLTGAEITRLAETDDEHADVARAVVEAAGHGLGRAIGGLLNAVDPGLVVLAGSVTRAGRRWRSALDQGVAASAMAVVAETPVVDAALGNAALIGAAAWAQEHRGTESE